MNLSVNFVVMVVVGIVLLGISAFILSGSISDLSFFNQTIGVIVE